MGKASEDTSLTVDKASEARKRRMERRAKKPGDEAVANKKMRLFEEEASDSESSTETQPSSTLSKDALAKIPGVKKQARYVPTVAMSKEELKEWRKQARRVRNRESAAASRQKTQHRITELEEEVGTLTKKYEAALKRIVELEAAAVAGNASSVWKPKSTPQHHQVDRVSSPVVGPAPTVSPPLSPRDDSFSLEQPQLDLETPLYPQTATTYKISRHNACVKIPNHRVVVAL